MQQETVNVFIAYAREDAAIKERLKKNLKAIFRNNQEDSLWDDGEINAGDDWQKAIRKALEQADIFLLLLSPDFIASDFCYETEMQKALEKHKKEEATVIPLLIRSCLWQNTPLKDLQILPEDSKAIHRSNEQHILDDLYLQITEKLHHISNTVKEQKRIKKLKEQFNHAYAKAELHFKYGEWLLASETYKRALTLRNDDFEVPQEVILSNIDKCICNLRYEELIAELNEALKKEELLKAKNVIEELILLRACLNFRKAD